MKSITLNNGLEMPMVGFGVFQVSDEDTEKAVLEALIGNSSGVALA